MKRTQIILAAAIAIAAAALYPRPVTKAEPKPVAKPSVKVNIIVAAGRVEPLSEEVKIGSELDGRLREVSAAEGSPVRRGQIIATIENGDFIARVELARAALAQREAELERLINGTRQEERREAKAQVREVEAILDNARAERDRRQMLLDRGAISRTEFDTVDREYRVAQARLEAARERSAFVDADARADERMRAEAEIRRARAQIQEAQASLEKTYIRSPIDGVVLRRYLKTGESVSANGNNPIAALGDTSRLRVRVDVDETDVARLRVGQQAWVTADAYQDRKFPGKVVQIGQALGRKNVRTDEPTERIDTKILETLIELDAGQTLPIGLRVDSFIQP